MPDTPSAARTVRAPEASSAHSQPSPKERKDVKTAASLVSLLPAEAMADCGAIFYGPGPPAYASTGTIPIASANISAKNSAKLSIDILIRCIVAPSFTIHLERRLTTTFFTITISSARSIR